MKTLIILLTSIFIIIIIREWYSGYMSKVFVDDVYKQAALNE